MIKNAVRSAVIMATEGYGNDRDAVSIRLVLFDSSLKTAEDIIGAVKKAVRYYTKRTSEERATYEMNCQAFNWGDFYNFVPNEICQRFGFRKEEDVPELTVETVFGEQLA
jgi:hypothetical protein